MLEPRDQTKNKNTPAKILTVLVVGIVLGLGLCGTGAAIGDRFPNTAGFLVTLGVVSFWTSLIWLIVWGLKFVISGLGKKNK